MYQILSHMWGAVVPAAVFMIPIDISRYYLRFIPVKPLFTCFVLLFYLCTNKLSIHCTKSLLWSCSPHVCQQTFLPN